MRSFVGVCRCRFWVAAVMVFVDRWWCSLCGVVGVLLCFVYCYLLVSVIVKFCYACLCLFVLLLCIAAFVVRCCALVFVVVCCGWLVVRCCVLWFVGSCCCVLRFVAAGCGLSLSVAVVVRWCLLFVAGF